MDRFELVEKLVKSTGVSFEDAKIALESSGWDLLDAAVWLERNGKVESRSGHFTTDPEQQQQQARSEEQQQRQQRTDAPRGSARSAGETGTTGKILRGIFSKIIKSDILVVSNKSFANTRKHWAFAPHLKQKKRGSISFLFLLWWALMDSNQRPGRYERSALTN